MPKGIKGFQKSNRFGETSWKNRRDYNGENNPHYGRTHTPEVKEKLRRRMLNEGSPTWKGHGVGYSAVHEWVRKRIPKPELCVKCRIKKAVHLSNTGHTYKRLLSDWEWLCGKCHKLKDTNMKLRAAYLRGYKDAKEGKNMEKQVLVQNYYQPIK